jgi:hypothetical protein
MDMKKIKASYVGLLTMWLLLASISGLAQNSTTGNIEGTVTDTNGTLVPNVTIVLSGDRLLRPLTATSNDDGVFRFLSVPPGKYSLKVEASADYDSFEQDNVEVHLSKTTSVTIGLKPKGEGVTMTANRGSAAQPSTPENTLDEQEALDTFR